ncbi:hypothetical protein [Teichococcus aestuarii]|uniref:hypothetical protein n=1 Tax=Teichococcus aestuarii TaxID=568898 RepID=UPI0011B26615|nr:hypothetical protein [Pseudoroseomonas aestuarii]
MPNGLPEWTTLVDQQAQRWLAAGCFEAVAKDLRIVPCLATGGQALPCPALLDNRTLRSMPESETRSGYEGAKRKARSKLHPTAGTPDHLPALHATRPSRPPGSPQIQNSLQNMPHGIPKRRFWEELQISSLKDSLGGALNSCSGRQARGQEAEILCLYCLGLDHLQRLLCQHHPSSFQTSGPQKSRHAEFNGCLEVMASPTGGDKNPALTL